MNHFTFALLVDKRLFRLKGSHSRELRVLLLEIVEEWELEIMIELGLFPFVFPLGQDLIKFLP